MPCPRVSPWVTVPQARCGTVCAFVRRLQGTDGIFITSVNGSAEKRGQFSFLWKWQRASGLVNAVFWSEVSDSFTVFMEELPAELHFALAALQRQPTPDIHLLVEGVCT